MQFRKILVQRS